MQDGLDGHFEIGDKEFGIADELCIFEDIRFAKQQVGSQNHDDRVVSRLIYGYRRHAGRRFTGHFDVARVDVIFFEVLQVVLSKHVVAKLNEQS